MRRESLLAASEGGMGKAKSRVSRVLSHLTRFKTHRDKDRCRSVKADRSSAVSHRSLCQIVSRTTTLVRSREPTQTVKWRLHSPQVV